MRALLRDYLEFLRRDLRWWLLPFLGVLAAITLLAWLGDSSPSFIYPIF